MQCTNWADGVFYVAPSGGFVLTEICNHLNGEDQYVHQTPIMIQYEGKNKYPHREWKNLKATEKEEEGLTNLFPFQGNLL